MKQIILTIIIFCPLIIIAGVKLSPELDSCIKTNSKLQTQISNQSLIIQELKGNNKELTLKNDTLVHTLKIAFEKNENKNDECDFDIYGFLGALLGAALSGGAAILVFFLGKKEESKKRNKGYEDFGEQIFILSKNLIKNSEKQKELIETYIKSLQEAPHSYGKYGRVSLNLFERAKSFDTTLVFNSFKQLKLENTSYIKYYNSLDYLYEFFASVYADYDTHNTDVVTPLSNKFIELRQEILDKAAIALREFKERGQDTSDIYKVLNQIIVKYYKSPDRPKVIDISYDVKMIIHPLKEELLKKEFNSYEIADTLLILAKRAGDYYQTIIDQAEILTSGLSSKLESLNSSIDKLTEIKNELEDKYAS